MCVIVHKPADKVVPKEHIIEACNHNPQGWGLAWIENGVVRTDHGFTAARAWKSVEAQMDKEFIFHARVATSGRVDWNNLHPFKITPEVYVAHNGMFWELSDKRSDFCDSWHFAYQMRPFFERYGTKLVETFIFQRWAEMYCGASSKLAFITPMGVTIINREHGVERDGIWYSNSSAFPPTPHHVRRGYIFADEEEERNLILDGLYQVEEEVPRKNGKKKEASPVIGALPPAKTDDEAITLLTKEGDSNYKLMKRTGTLSTHAFPPSEE